MSARPGQEAAPAETPAAAAYKHDQALLRALHKGLRVKHKGKPEYVHTIRSQRSGGGVETEVYLAGDPVAYSAIEITFEDPPR